MPCYNGVRVEESEIVYQRVLDKLYNDAVAELLSASVDREMLIKRLREIRDDQSCFYCPSKDEIRSRRYEEEQSKSVSLKEETDYLEFMMNCVMLQRYYLSRLSAYFTDARLQETDERETMTNNQQIAEMEDAEQEDAIIKGVDGLAKFLGCGKTMAQKILNSKVLQKAGIAYRMGREWRLNKEELSSFMKDNPEVFRW